MNPTHDVHLIYNERDKPLVKQVYEGLQLRGLVPWFWDIDAPDDWYNGEVASITEKTPASAVFLGPAGWGQTYHLQFAQLASASAPATIPVLLPGWRPQDLSQLPGVFQQRWIEFQSTDDPKPLAELAQRIVDAAYKPGKQPPRGDGSAPAPNGDVNGRRLVVYVPARSQTVESWQSLTARLRQEPALRDAVWYGHRYRAGTWSRATLESLALQLDARITANVTEANRRDPATPVRHITLMGHSFGGVLTRASYLIAAGKYREHRPNESSWWSLVDRIVLFGAPNRGIESRRLPWRDRAVTWWPFGERGRLTRDQLVGSEAITNLRIRWIRFFVAELHPARRPIVVQFLAEGDRWVKREDSLDLEQFPDAWQSDVPGAHHSDLQRVPDGDEDRYTILRQGILDVNPANLSTGEPREHKRSPVVIVLHGIRANNETWAEQVQEEIERRAPNALAVAPTYRYFPMLDFAIPWLRAKKIRTLQDQYSDLLARFPRARFCFVGHSNGTYILGHCLERLPGMRFDRLTLVGSVLPREYDWQARFKQRQVREISNHRSAHDVPVSIGCNLLRAYGMKDVGTAGFDGFDQRRDEIKEVYYYDGGHSCPLATDNLQRLVDYTLTGRADFPLARKDIRSGQFVSRLSSSTLIGLVVGASLAGALAASAWALHVSLGAVTSWPPALSGAIASTVVVALAYLLSRYY